MPELILEAGRTEKNYWSDLWVYRELFYILAWRDIIVRYKETTVGIAWVLLRPFLTMLIFTVLFGRIAKFHSDGNIPYPLLVMGGMLVWQFFSGSLSQSSESLVASSNLISKIYFPRLIVPASSVITSFADFTITLVLVALMMVWYKFLPDWHLLALPLFVILAFGSAFGTGLWLSALTVKYRDTRIIVPFIVQFGLYVSPVGFSTSIVPQKWRLLYSLNPVVGVIDGFRWSLLRGESPLWWPSILLSTFTTVVLCVSGIWYFRRIEKTFADVI